MNVSKNCWQVNVLTLFPEMFPGPLGCSLAGKALVDGIWSLETVNIKKFAKGKNQLVDDTPFGGGPGMVMRADVLDKAICSVYDSKANEDLPILYLTPKGVPLRQSRVKALGRGKGVVIVCGRYEGIDERAIMHWNMEEISLGDYVLSGGEPAAISLLDACIRVLPGVMGNPLSQKEESFENGLLEHPQYTRPRKWGELEAPKVLLSGHHQEISDWRREKAEATTRTRRPDLWSLYVANQEL